MVIRFRLLSLEKNRENEKPAYLVNCHFYNFPGCSKKASENNIKVMTLNVRYDNPEDSVFSWPKRASQVCDFILSEKPDILGLQEVLWHQYKVLETILLDYSSIGAGCTDGAKEGEMNPVFFRKEKFNMIRNIPSGYQILRKYREQQDGVLHDHVLLHGWSLLTRKVINIFSFSIHILHTIPIQPG
jgi:hypothetical protein